MVKKIIVLFLIMFSVFSLTSCNSNNYKDRSLKIDLNDSAILSICADNGKGESTFLSRNYGHAFLAITNISTDSFIIGDQEVESGETITVGLWSIVEHFGVWFNVESNYIKERDKYNTRVSANIGIELAEIEKINEVIKNNDKWNPLYNCSKFALDIWNLVAEQHSEKINVPMFVSPSYLVDEIKRFKDHEFKQVFETSTNVRYYGEN